MNRIKQELLAKVIRNKREKLELSQSQLASAAHINRAMISKIENGTYMPSIAQLEDLQEVLGFSFDEIREKKEEGIPAKIFALTYRDNFFCNLGFRIVEKDMFPEKIWSDCVLCPKQNCCDEIAVLLELS